MVFSVWDRVLGTWSNEAVEPDATYGVGDPEPESAIAMQVDGWRRASRPTVESEKEQPPTRLLSSVGRRFDRRALGVDARCDGFEVPGRGLEMLGQEVDGAVASWARVASKIAVCSSATWSRVGWCGRVLDHMRYSSAAS